MDGAGNVYVLAGSSINEYSANSLNGPPTRSLTVGPETAVSTVQDVMASSTGEIFVSDSNGIAVFSPTATGNASPLRYILGPPKSTGGTTSVFSPGLITVDGSDNLYVQNTSDSTIVVFGPTDTGNVVPARTISGPLTRVSGNSNYVTGMTTDTVGNLYVLCISERTDGTGRYDFGVFEFDPAANGNVAPTRFVTAPEMYPYFGNDGVAVDSAGTIYVSAIYPNFTPTLSMPAVFEFSASDSGTVAPLNIVTLKGWTNADPSRIAVN
jgi:sugar lactone lactonase YvrE